MGSEVEEYKTEYEVQIEIFFMTTVVESEELSEGIFFVWIGQSPDEERRRWALH